MPQKVKAILDPPYLNPTSYSLRWLEDEKAWFAPIETDIKDAKRRINLKKGSKPRKAPAEATGPEHSASEDEASE